MQKLFAALSIAFMLASGVNAGSATAQTPKGQRKSTQQKQSRKSSKGKKATGETVASNAINAAASLPSADQIFDRYQKAIGTQEAFRKLTSRVSRGTFTLSTVGISAPAEVYEKAPNKALTVIDFPGFGAIMQGYNGTIAFEQQPQSGLRELSGKELNKAKREADFYEDLNMKSQYAKLIVKGIEVVGGSNAYRIEATTADGDVEQLYFDKLTSLLVRKDEATVTPQGVLPVQIYFEDYREVDGIKIPFGGRITNPSIGNIIMKLTEVKHNVEIADSKFDKPVEP